MERETLKKAYALDKVVEHLEKNALRDPRHRERMRAKLALTKIRGWIEEGGQVASQQV